MIDYKIAQQHLSEMLGLMTNARTPSSYEMLDLTVFRSAARFVHTGRDFECAAAAELPGFAQLPLELLPKIQETAEFFADDPVRIRIEEAKVRIKSATISHP